MSDTENTVTTTAKRSKRPGVAFSDIDNLLARVCDERYEIVVQSAFIQVKGPQGHRLYVAKQETVRRIDLAFLPEGVDVIRARKPNGTVEHELDTADEACLTRLEQVLLWMSDAPAPVVEKRQAFVPKLKAVAQKRGLTEEQMAQAEDERKERVAKYMAQRQGGVEISASADI